MSINPDIEHASKVPDPAMSRRVQLRQAVDVKQKRVDEEGEALDILPTPRYIYFSPT
jgi:hypothetical protein